MADWQSRDQPFIRCPVCGAAFYIEERGPVPDRLKLPLHEPKESDPNKASLEQVCPGSHQLAEVIIPGRT